VVLVSKQAGVSSGGIEGNTTNTAHTTVASYRSEV
jgi:hypothetical protein